MTVKSIREFFRDDLVSFRITPLKNSDCMKDNLFIIRVYGLYINEKQRLLVSDEYVFGQNMTKFPGGGLEYGENNDPDSYRDEPLTLPLIRDALAPIN